MALFDFLKPEWKQSSPTARIAGISQLEDESILVGLAENDPDESVRRAASERLDQVRVNSFRRLTASGDPEGDIEALMEISATGATLTLREAAYKRLVNLLIEAFCDKEAIGGSRVSKETGMPMVNIQRLALATAARITADSLVDPLIKIVSEDTAGPYVLSEAIAALGNQCDTRGIDPLKRIIDRPGHYAPGAYVDAARALVKIGEPESIRYAASKGLLYGDPEVDSLIEETVAAWVHGDRQKFDASFTNVRALPDEGRAVSLLHMRFDDYFVGSSSVSKDTWERSKTSYDAIEAALRDQRGYDFKY